MSPEYLYGHPTDEQCVKANLDLWIEATDFPRVHTPSFDQRDAVGPSMTEQVVRKLPPAPTSLESLSVQGNNAVDFIMALPPASLKHLSRKNAGRHLFKSDFDDMLRHAGANLTGFEWHVDELLLNRPVLSVE